MAPATLFNQALYAGMQRIKYIEDVGEAPYDLVRPLLLKVENADQLRRIEQNSPQIVGRDAEVWKMLLKRDAPKWVEDQSEPKNPESWHKLYNLYIKEDKKRIAAQTRLLQEKLQQSQRQREERRVTISDIVVDEKKRDCSGVSKAQPTGNSAIQFLKKRRVQATNAGAGLLKNNSRFQLTEATKAAIEQGLVAHSKPRPGSSRISTERISKDCVVKRKGTITSTTLHRAPRGSTQSLASRVQNSSQVHQAGRAMSPPSTLGGRYKPSQSGYNPRSRQSNVFAHRGK